MLRFLSIVFFLLPFTSAAGTTPDSSRNLVAVNIVPAAWGMAAVSYERVFGKGKFALRLPLSVGFSKAVGSDEGGSPKFTGGVYALGIDLNFYSGEGYFAPRKVKWHFGPSFEYIAARYIHYSPMYDSLVGGYVPFRDDRTGYQYCVLFKTGCKFSSNRRFFFSPALGLGLRFFEGYGRSFGPTATFELNAGYKF